MRKVKDEDEDEDEDMVGKEKKNNREAVQRAASDMIPYNTGILVGML